MTGPASTIRTVIDQAMAAEPQMTAFMAALANRHGGGGLERGAKANSQSRHEDGEVRSENEMLAALTGPMRKLLKAMDIDPARANAAVMAIRADGGVLVHLVVVRPGDIDKGQFASFEGYTEKEYFSIANGPKPERYPYLKMPQPVGEIVEILPDGSLGKPMVKIPEPLDWVDAPLDWNSIAGLPKQYVLPPIGTETKPWSETRDVPDPFVTDVLNAVAMEPPGLRDIRRMGVDNGYRDARGNMIE